MELIISDYHCVLKLDINLVQSVCLSFCLTRKTMKDGCKDSAHTLLLIYYKDRSQNTRKEMKCIPGRDIQRLRSTLN